MEKSQRYQQLRELLLNFPKEHKQFLLRSAIEEKNFGVYMAYADIFLSAPISEGGLASEDIPHPAHHVNEGN